MRFNCKYWQKWLTYLIAKAAVCGWLVAKIFDYHQTNKKYCA